VRGKVERGRGTEGSQPFRRGEAKGREMERHGSWSDAREPGGSVGEVRRHGRGRSGAAGGRGQVGPAFKREKGGVGRRMAGWALRWAGRRLGFSFFFFSFSLFKEI
jgi:hypothetical protein